MGMGMLGALGGLGEAGVGIGKQMMASALREDELAAVEQRQVRLAQMQEKIKIAAEDRAQGRIDKDRQDVADTVTGIQLPEGATEKDRLLAEANALKAKGRLAEGDHSYRRAKDIEKNDVENKRYDATTERDKQRYEIQSAREERMARAQEQSIRLQGAAAGRAAEDQRFQREDRSNKEKATGMLAGYKIAKSRGLDAAADVYLEQSMGLGVDPRMIDKNDPLSSQVSAAKAVLADYEATPEEKSSARKVLSLANDSFVDRKNGAPSAPAAAQSAAKEMSYAQLQQFASAKKMSVEDAKALAKANGYSVK